MEGFLPVVAEIPILIFPLNSMAILVEIVTVTARIDLHKKWYFLYMLMQKAFLQNFSIITPTAT